jgi:hypothetical protein
MTHLAGARGVILRLGLLLAPDRELLLRYVPDGAVQVNADLFAIVDLVSLARLFNSFRRMRLPEPPASDTLRETTLG